MEYKRIYPKKHGNPKNEYTARRVILGIFILGFIVTGIVNLVLKGQPWSLLVLVAEWLFWVVFVERPLVENTFTIKVQKIVIGTSILLIAILWFLKKPELFDSIPIVLSSGQIFIGLTLLLSYRSRTKKTFRLLYIVSGFFILLACLVLSIILKNWYQFLLFGIAALILIIDSILYRREINSEFVRRLNVKKL